MFPGLETTLISRQCHRDGAPMVGWFDKKMLQGKKNHRCSRKRHGCLEKSEWNLMESYGILMRLPKGIKNTHSTYGFV